jgi:hypothetical protein
VPLHEEVAKANEAIIKMKAKVAELKEERTAMMATIFLTTANFLRGDGKPPWKYRGASNTHNTCDCKKYDHQGNLKKGFKGKRDSSTPPGVNKSYAQLYAEETQGLYTKKLKKHLKKSSKKSKKHKYESSDSESRTLTSNEGVG